MSRQRKGMDIFLRTGKSHRQPISEFQNASNTLKASENLLGISPAWKIQVMPPLWSIANKKCSFRQSQFFSLSEFVKKKRLQKNSMTKENILYQRGPACLLLPLRHLIRRMRKLKLWDKMRDNFKRSALYDKGFKRKVFAIFFIKFRFLV